eukprot:Filipodium_phascolosomae@DN8340_c0_g1_i1.p1
MARRFYKEGLTIKNRTPIYNTGWDLWVEDFKWRSFTWHYDYYMGPTAQKVIASNPEGAGVLSSLMLAIKTGDVNPQCPVRTHRIYVRTCIPQIVPYLRTSNPFCPFTDNRTGWKEYLPKLKLEPQPRIDHKIAGTTDAAPVHPPRKR